jgi:hypothetical protein
MGASSFDPTAPDCPEVTDYDRAHTKTYLRLLDAEADEASWEAMAAEVLGQDIGAAPAAAHLMVESHLQRARWLRDSGYLRLLGD